MWIIKRTRLKEFWTKHPNAKAPLEGWSAASAADWESFDDVRQTFRHADQIRLDGGKTVVVFNVGGNKYRLVTAVLYRAHQVLIRQFLTHAEYSKNKWKQEEQ